MRRLCPLFFALVGCAEPAPVSSPPAGTGSAVPGYTPTLPAFRHEVPSNLLMISLDTFRKDQVGRYGGENTPFLDELIAEGFVLDDHTQCSNWTYASTTCTLLGRYNLDNGFMPKLSSAHREPVPEGTPFLATWLNQAGMYPILLSANSWLSEEWNNDQGYRISEVPGNRNATHVYETGRDHLLDARASGQADRWFLHLHFKEPHPAYDPPEEYLEGLAGLDPVDYDLSSYEEHYSAVGAFPSLDPEDQALVEQHLRVRYAGEVRYLDDQLRDMFAGLDALGLLDDTLVVVWTDHGEQFWEHGDLGHAYELTAPENDGVAFFWARSILPGAWEGPTTAIDLVPTLLSLYGLPMPDEVTGKPVGSADPRRPRYGASDARFGPVQMVDKERWKLQFWWDGSLQLYDRGLDPSEAVDLYQEGHPKVKELWPLLETRVEQLEELAPEDEVHWPPFSTHHDG